ncbi:MAG TPA: hypothetical protein VNN80_15075 [Polyangiaceae bacterium]|nr:hypothetical protein [Polyangiaceae bacterium]
MTIPIVLWALVACEQAPERPPVLRENRFAALGSDPACNATAASCPVHCGQLRDCCLAAGDGAELCALEQHRCLEACLTEDCKRYPQICASF